MLEDYCRRAEQEGIQQRLKIFVIPDRKSPQALFERCTALSDRGFNIVCPSLTEQEKFLAGMGPISQRIPYNSDNRRNAGFLMALDWGCDVMISLDDDNHVGQSAPLYTDYSIVLQDKVSLPAVHSSTGWFNICDLLELDSPGRVFPRGFPYRKRHEPAQIRWKEETGAVRLNAGLWLMEPDLDAITWLASPARSKSFKGQSVLLGNDTWSPINTQNTSLHRDLIVSYYFVRMGYPLAGMKIDRYGDIFSGYLSQACVRHMGHRIRVGTPIAEHRRNAHDYFRDLAAEFACIWLLEDFTEWLREAKLQGSTYAETYLSLADAIEAQSGHFAGSIWEEDARAYLRDMAQCMREWVAACRRVGG